MTITPQTLSLDVLALDNAALDRAIDEADATVNATVILEGLTAERQRRADQHAADLAECAALLEMLTADLAHREADYRTSLDALSQTPSVEAWPLVEHTYKTGRQCYTLSHDLLAVTGDPRFRRAYRVSDDLKSSGGQVAEHFQRSILNRPPVLDSPWRADLAKLKALIGPRPSAIQNGG